MQTAVLRSARKTSGAGRVVRDKRIGGPVSGEFGDLSSPAPFCFATAYGSGLLGLVIGAAFIFHGFIGLLRSDQGVGLSAEQLDFCSAHPSVWLRL